MSRKDFELIASVFRNTKALTHEEAGMKECLLDRMADALRRTNPGFDRARFINACKVD